MVDRLTVPVLPGSSAGNGSGTGNCHYRRRYFHASKNLSGVWEGISSHHQSGILFGCLPGLCTAKIRAGTKAPRTAKSKVMCTQFTSKSACIARLFGFGFEGAYIRILRPTETGVSCGQRKRIRRDADRDNNNFKRDHVCRYHPAIH